MGDVSRRGFVREAVAGTFGIITWNSLAVPTPKPILIHPRFRPILQAGTEAPEAVKDMPVHYRSLIYSECEPWYTWSVGLSPSKSTPAISPGTATTGA